LIKKEFGITSFFAKYGTIAALILLFIVFSIIVPGFLSYSNFINILRQMSLLFILSVGFTMCLIVGELDLSFANVASLSSVVVAKLIVSGLNYLISIVIALSIGASIGLFSGLLVTLVGISSLITTLAMGIILSGVTYMYTKGVSVYGHMPAPFLQLGRGMIGSIPILVIIMFIVLIAAQVFVKQTRFGRYMQATGGNRTAALLAGVNVTAYKILGLVFSSLGAAFTGILLTSRLGAANPEGAAGFLMDGFATALLGQTVISVGRASPIGTFVGALLVGILNNGMTLLGVPYYVHDIAKGVIIILSVVITSIHALKLERA